MKAHRPRAPARVGAFLLVLILVLGPRPARGAGDRAILTLFLNHADKGEVTVVLRDGDVLVREQDLVEAGLIGLPSRAEQAPGHGLLSLASLSPPLSFAVDEAALALRVEAPPRMLKTTVISAAPNAPAGIEQRRDTSVFLNYALRAALPLELDSYLEAGLSAGGNLLQTSLTATSAPSIVRGLTSYTVDDRSNLRRWIVGDAFVSAGALGAGLFVGGLSVSKTFALDPYFIHTPSLGYTGSTTTPAILDVYVNGVLVKSAPIPPGPFQVQNIQAPTGAGDVRYVVRDVFGQQNAVSSPYYASGTSLKAGLSEYTYAFGASRLDVGTQSFDYGAIGLLARHRYGVTDRLTAGLRFEGAAGLVSLGPSATLVLPVGQIDLEVATSAAGGRAYEAPAWSSTGIRPADPGAAAIPLPPTSGGGFAALAAYTYASRKLSCGLVARAVSDRYATLSMAPADDRDRLQLNAFTAVAIGPRLGLSSQYTLALDRDLGTSFRVGTTATVRLARALSLALGVGRAFTQQEGASFTANATLTFSFAGNMIASIGVTQDTGVREAYAEVSRALPPGDGFGYRLYGVASDTPSALAVGQYQGPYGLYGATAQISSAARSAELDAAGALVWVRGGGVAATRPVQDGFAFVRVPGVDNVRGFLNNQELGRTDGRGDLVLPNLLSYYGNRISIADTDIAIDRTVAAVERVIAPPYRGGALVVFDASPARFFRGKVVVETAGGKLVEPAFGELSVEGAGSPLGRHGEFELEGVGPGSYSARIVYAKSTCTFELVVPRSDHAVADLGEQRCKQPR